MKVHVGDIQFKVFLYYAQIVKFDLGPLIVGKPMFFFPFLESSSLATHEVHVVLNWLKIWGGRNFDSPIGKLFISTCLLVKFTR
jgi:hypothetical protein